MTKRAKGSLIIAGIISAFLIVGGVVYIQQKNKSKDSQPPISNCKIFGGREYCAENYIGLSEREAVAQAQDDGLEVRVVESDEDPNLASTSDRRDKRVNLTVADGVVTVAEFY